mmetsp:Transcript_2787/g.7368  ORF Transcript_2787/g.7368 Transcript_2787/m.7368 type:complete len:368 (+) Transcript_2787:350-1453(+)|eukprot:jgi/Tetstr1/462250/TSEL_000648.t1
MAAAAAEGDWEDEWDTEVALQLSGEDSLEDGELPGDGIEWGEWGELPGQPTAPSTKLLHTTAPAVRRVSESASSRTQSFLSPRSKEDSITLEEQVESMRSNGSGGAWLGRTNSFTAPLISDSPQVTLRSVPTEPEPAGPSSERVPSPERDELEAYLADWGAALDELREYMTRNELQLVSVVKQRTQQWLESEASDSGDACASKTRFLKRMQAVVEVRKREWQSRSAAAETLSDTIAGVRALCGDPEGIDGKRGKAATAVKPENVRYLSLEANVAAAWLQDQVSSQLKQSKVTDPVIMTEEILASERKLRAACIDVFGTERGLSGLQPAAAVGVAVDASEERVQRVPDSTRAQQAAAAPPSTACCAIQ